jgi:hypothetical protein
MHALLYLGIGAAALLGALAITFGDDRLEQYAPVAEAPPLPGPPPLDEGQDDDADDDAFTSNWGVDG